MNCQSLEKVFFQPFQKSGDESPQHNDILRYKYYRIIFLTEDYYIVLLTNCYLGTSSMIPLVRGEGGAEEVKKNILIST